MRVRVHPVRVRSVLLALLVALGVAAPAAPAALAQDAFADSQAQAKMFVRPDGTRVRVAIRVTIDHGWHLYHKELGPKDAVGKATTVTFGGPATGWSEVRFPTPKKLPQPGLGENGRDTWIYGHEGTIVLYAAATLPPGESATAITAEIDGLTCEDQGSCVPFFAKLTPAGPGADALFAAFPEGLGAAAAPGSTAPGSSEAGSDGSATGAGPTDGGGATAGLTIDAFPTYEPQAKPVTHGLGMWLLLAFIAGVILNVMPCVLPVISIKVLSFVQQAGEDRARVLHLGLAFSAGIVVVFLALAGLAIGAGMSWGEQFQSEAFMVTMIAVVFAFALSLFGVFEIGIPAGVGGASFAREGLGDAFFKGMLATVLATPCSGPFLGSTLAWTLTQPAMVVFLIFLCLGLGMAIPYVVLTAFPGLLKLLPRPGAWMETFKQAMGFLLVATAVYLMISLRQDRILFVNVFLAFVGIGCWWWGRFADYTRPRWRRMVTLAFSVLLIGGGGYLSFGVLRPALQPEARTAGDHLAWEDFDAARFLAYQREGRSVLLDFTADWCPNCKWNELHVYESELVQRALRAKGVVALKADMTRHTKKTELLAKLRRRLGARSIPFVALFPGNDPKRPYVRHDIVDREDFQALVDALPSP